MMEHGILLLLQFFLVMLELLLSSLTLLVELSDSQGEVMLWPEGLVVHDGAT